MIREIERRSGRQRLTLLKMVVFPLSDGPVRTTTGSPPFPLFNAEEDPFELDPSETTHIRSTEQIQPRMICFRFRS